MQQHDVISAARSAIDEFDLPNEDENYELHQALVSDEAFRAAAYLYEQATIYADHENAVAADAEARDALKRSVREHAQRVKQEVEN